LKFHSFWIPCDKPPEGADEVYLEALKMHVVGYGDGDIPVGWVRYDEDAPYPDIVRHVPHPAFVVEDMTKALLGRRVIIPPNTPSPGLKVAFIEDCGVPVEFLEIDFDILPDGI